MEIRVPFLGYLELNIKMHIGYKSKTEKEVCEIYQNLSHIPAIKYYKKETGSELRESKEAVDKILIKHGLKEGK